METTSLQMFNATVQYINDSIAIKPFCEFFGLDFQNQCERIKRDIILSQLYGNFRTVAQDSKKREMFCLTKRGFIRWIDRLSPQNVAENLREKFIQFQILIDEYLNGSTESKNEIARLTVSIAHKRSQYSQLGNEIQFEVKQRERLLNQTYQYSLSFNNQTVIA